MDSVLSESLIGVLASPPEDYSNSETASCLVKPSSSCLFTANLSKRFDQQAPAAISHQAKFRVAVLSMYAQYKFTTRIMLIYIGSKTSVGIEDDLAKHKEALEFAIAAQSLAPSNPEVAEQLEKAKRDLAAGIEHLDLDSHDEEQTETTEEANVPSRYYCYQCRQVVSVTVDVEITCPLCQAGWIQECGGVSSLYLAMPSESEHSASNGIVTPGRTWSPFHSFGSQDYDIYDESHEETVYDSNLGQSFILNNGSHADTGNNMPGHVSPYDSSLEQGLLPLGIDVDIVTDQPDHHRTRVTTSVWIFSVTGFGFEAVSAFFDQVSTPRKPHYALYGMLLSILSVLICILDLIHNAKKQRGVASASETLWGILPEVFGLALACIQCISSVLQFSFLRRHAANPVKVSLVPFLFFFVLFAFKYRNRRNGRN